MHPKSPTLRDVRVIAAEINRSERAVRNAFAGRSKPIVVEQVRDAIRRLGLEVEAPPARALVAARSDRA